MDTSLYKPQTRYELSVSFDALQLAWVKGAAFTYSAFCTLTERKDTRHLRRVFKTLVSKGVLYTYSMKFNDGKFRSVFCAQRTLEMPLLTDPMEAISPKVLTTVKKGKS